MGVSPQLRRAAALELAKRKQAKEAILAELHSLQKEVANYLLEETSPRRSKWIALTCGRRAGKSVLDAHLIVLALLDSGPNEWVGYGAVTRGQAKRIIWRELCDLISRLALPWAINETLCTISVPSRGSFLLTGFDNASEVHKLRGLKFRLFVCDEPATYEHLLEELLREVLEPAFGDTRGSLVLSGTPGTVCAGFWHGVSTGLVPGYRRWTWTVRDNPYFYEPDDFLEQVKERNGWQDRDPVYRREYLAEWVEDEGSLVYSWNDGRNAVTRLPDDYDVRSWIHTIGIDYGFRDSTAWCVLASHPHRREIVVVHAEKEIELLDDQIAERTHTLIQRFNPSSIVGDSAAPHAIEAFNRRFGASSGRYIRGADKRGKMAHITLLNTELRSGRLTVCLPTAGCLAGEMRVLPWSNGQRVMEHPGFDNHACDAALYAFMEHRSFLHSDPTPPKGPNQWDVDSDRAREERIRRFVQDRRGSAYERTERKLFG